jgi:hypothetical protein
MICMGKIVGVSWSKDSAKMGEAVALEILTEGLRGKAMDVKITEPHNKKRFILKTTHIKGPVTLVKWKVGLLPGHVGTLEYVATVVVGGVANRKTARSEVLRVYPPSLDRLEWVHPAPPQVVGALVRILVSVVDYDGPVVLQVLGGSGTVLDSFETPMSGGEPRMID